MKTCNFNYYLTFKPNFKNWLESSILVIYHLRYLTSDANKFNKSPRPLKYLHTHSSTHTGTLYQHCCQGFFLNHRDLLPHTPINHSSLSVAWVSKVCSSLPLWFDFLLQILSRLLICPYGLELVTALTTAPSPSGTASSWTGSQHNAALPAPRSRLPWAAFRKKLCLKAITARESKNWFHHLHRSTAPQYSVLF